MEAAGVQPFSGAPFPGPDIQREVCPSAREAGDTPIQLEPGRGLEFPNAFMLEFQHQSEGASEVRLTELTAPPLGASDACETQKGSQNAKFPRDEGIAPFVKHLGEHCGALERGSREHLPESPAGQ